MSGSSSTELSNDYCSKHHQGYSCSNSSTTINATNGTYDYTLTVTWNGETITSGVLSQSNNNGDHVYRFYLEFGKHEGGDWVARKKYITVRGELFCITYT